MGTSTAWDGPSGGRWSSAGRRLARWRPESHRAEQRLEEIAGDYLLALHETVRADRSAFGLYDAACGAGERLADSLNSLGKETPDSAEAFLGFLAREVGGYGGTIADAAVRAAATSAGHGVLELRPELEGRVPHSTSDINSNEFTDPEVPIPSPAEGGGAPGGGLASDILCGLYRLFFAEVVAEFLRSVVAEQVELAVPVLIAADPEGRIADAVAQRVLALVPDPCEEAAGATALTAPPGTGGEGVPAALPGLVPEPAAATLPEIARRLVPTAVGRALGLITEASLVPGEAAA